MKSTLDYEVGQTIRIGYYGGFHWQEKKLAKAIITQIDKDITGLIYIDIYLKPGGIRKMFGLASDLKEMEKNYKDWIDTKEN